MMGVTIRIAYRKKQQKEKTRDPTTIYSGFD